MRALWSDRPNCSHKVSQEVKRIGRFSEIVVSEEGGSIWGREGLYGWDRFNNFRCQTIESFFDPAEAEKWTKRILMEMNGEISSIHQNPGKTAENPSNGRAPKCRTKGYSRY